MKKITTERIQELFDRGILLLATQGKICVPIINRIYTKMLNGMKFPDIKVSGQMICNGHHRYIASLLADVEIGKAIGITSTRDTIDWKAVILDNIEWETAADIALHNRNDALYNEMEVGKIEELLRNL